MDVPYYHVVFTMPEQLRSLCLHQPRVMYNLLFKSSWQVIQILAADEKYLGAQAGMTAVLHTWSQTLGLHPHLHCIIPGGGVKNKRWKYTRSKGKYLYPAKVMSILFRSIFLKELKQLIKRNVAHVDQTTINKLYKSNWVVYAKKPFQSPNHVIEYLGRYTHKIGISNYRIIKVDSSHVYFKWKDYRHAAKLKVMRLTIKEFIRRFAMHILPHRFVRIRHYGILGYRNKNVVIRDIQKQQNYTPSKSTVIPIVNPVKEECEVCSSTRLLFFIIVRQNSRSP